MEDLFARKATAEEKGKFLDLIVGSLPPHVDFTASVSGEDVSLVDKLADVAMTFAGGSAPLTAAGGQVKLRHHQGTPGRDSRVSVCGSPKWSDICG